MVSRAATGFWTGAEDGFWTNAANWSASPYAGAAAGEAAHVDAASANTTLDLAGLPSILHVSFDTAAAAGCTLGTGGANAQTLVLENSGSLALSNGVVNSQTVSAAVQLGTTTATASYTFRNDSAGATLTLNGNVAGAAAGGTAGTKTLNLTGTGGIVLNGVLSNGGASSLILNTYGDDTLAGDNTFSGNIVVLDKGLRLTHSNALGVTNKTVTAANNVNGRNPSVILDGSAGNLTIPSNITFVTSNSRAGAVINDAGDNTILGNFNLTSGDGATHIWSKGGTLTLAGNLTPSTT